jgi:hypothetical protein
MIKEISFREFVETIPSHQVYTDMDVMSMYFDEFDKKSVKEISNITGRSIGEIYRTLSRNNFQKNRSGTNHYGVLSLASQGFSPEKIAEFTGYTARNVRYILKKELVTEGKTCRS